MKRPEDMSRDELLAEVTYWRGQIDVSPPTGAPPHGLTPTEYAVMVLLLKAPGPISGFHLLSHVMGKRNLDDAEALFKVYVCHIRKKLGADAIENVRPGRYQITDAGRRLMLQPMERAA